MSSHDDNLVRVPGTLLRLSDVLQGLHKMALTASTLAAEAKKVEADPTEAQKESGNYKKGHISWKGFPITIETAKGQYRRGKGKDGKPWQTLMRDHYGYFKRTESDADGDHIDVFVSGDADLRSELVFVVNQRDPSTGKFDEHKVVVGCVDEESAKETYLRNYESDWKGFGSIRPMSLPEFKRWLEKGDTAKEAHFPKSTPMNIVLVKRARDEDEPFTIAVDLDGTLAEKEEPFDPKSIGPPRERALYWVRLFHEAGARIIIFTVRGDSDMVADWLEGHDVPYDYINENPDQPEDSSGKVIADAYWDDRAYNAQDPDEHGPSLLHQIVNHGKEDKEPERGNPDIRITISKSTYVLLAPPELFDALTEDDHEQGREHSD